MSTARRPSTAEAAALSVRSFWIGCTDWKRESTSPTVRFSNHETGSRISRRATLDAMPKESAVPDESNTKDRSSVAPPLTRVNRPKPMASTVIRSASKAGSA